ncbi:dGTP triphosphohydrolase [Celeribacter baekdonensis]|uniref:Deoxyguanosinetriphosphate triphosphohydrolase n=1 Tax=Celeribacter baekdonensis B30 TaxID=1208323 RepID=K2JX04_9RHOB|nr:dNTP triphosphohydrolase [Celeribacter baekdonensis]EKE69740.1 deoxyguanosinetriphosphate triphosphohydrolase [Celeribacter baekdonensis B30]
MRMNWENLLEMSLLHDEVREINPNRPNYAQDYDRLVFSLPFRRLANKTQVHPLYAHDHIHHRLIHSIETSSVGRSLGIEVGHWLETQGEIAEGQRHVLSGVVQAACIAHDIGNPPFGHSGEDAMGAWFAARFAEGHSFFDAVQVADRTEFEKFEGNAQGFRLISRLEMYRNEGGMRLSHAVLGAFTKYPALAEVSEKAKARDKEKTYKGLTKFGLFRSEYDLFERVAERCGLLVEQGDEGRWWRRHPAVFLVEAADDICYNILDLEDAYVTGDLSEMRVKELLGALFAGDNQDLSGKDVTYYRARAIGAAIHACVAAFKQNYEAIMTGHFSASLISKSDVSAQFAKIEATAHSQIFTAPRKTKLEVTGRNILHAVLTGLLPIYEELGAQNWDVLALSAYHRQLAAAADIDLRDVVDEYTALHSLTDFVSGMTDRYAVRVHAMIAGQMG